MPAEKFTTKLIVTETKEIHSGKTKKGTPYSIWQIIATKPDGTPISDFNLRSFSDLPKNEVLEVECELYQSEQYGDSYTVSRKGGSGSGKLTKEVGELRERVEKIENWIRGRQANGSSAQATPPPKPPDAAASAQPGSAVAAPPPPPPVQQPPPAAEGPADPPAPQDAPPF